MKTTMDLLEKALKTPNTNAAEWCRRIGVNRTALHCARRSGRLSPTIAGNLAALLDEDQEYWIALAALEGEPDTPAKTTLLRGISNWRKR